MDLFNNTAEVSHEDVDDIYDDLEENDDTKNLSRNANDSFSKTVLSTMKQNNVNLNTDLDLYLELLQADNEEKRKKEEKEKVDYNNMLKENSELKNIKVFLEDEVKTLKSENVILKQNISSLFKTAKSEIDFKSGLILELRSELDEYIFRRKVPNKHRPLPDANKQNYNHHYYSRNTEHDEYDEINSRTHIQKSQLNSRSFEVIDTDSPSNETNYAMNQNENSSEENLEFENMNCVLEHAFEEFAQKQVTASEKLLNAVHSFEEQQSSLVERLKEATMIVLNSKDNSSTNSNTHSNGISKRNYPKFVENSSHSNDKRHNETNSGNTFTKKCKLSPKKFSISTKKDILKLYGYHSTDVPYAVRRKLGLPISKHPCNISHLPWKSKSVKQIRLDNKTISKESNLSKTTDFTDQKPNSNRDSINLSSSEKPNINISRQTSISSSKHSIKESRLTQPNDAQTSKSINDDDYFCSNSHFNFPNSKLLSSNISESISSNSIMSKCFVDLISSEISTINHESNTINHESSNMNHKSSSINPESSNINPESSNINPESNNINPESSNINHESSTKKPSSNTSRLNKQHNISCKSECTNEVNITCVNFRSQCISELRTENINDNYSTLSLPVSIKLSDLGPKFNAAFKLSTTEAKPFQIKSSDKPAMKLAEVKNHISENPSEISPVHKEELINNKPTLVKTKINKCTSNLDDSTKMNFDNKKKNFSALSNIECSNTSDESVPSEFETGNKGVSYEQNSSFLMDKSSLSKGIKDRFINSNTSLSGNEDKEKKDNLVQVSVPSNEQTTLCTASNKNSESKIDYDIIIDFALSSCNEDKQKDDNLVQVTIPSNEQTTLCPAPNKNSESKIDYDSILDFALKVLDEPDISLS